MKKGVSIEVVYVDGRKEKYDYMQDQVTVGSAPDADLHIPLTELSPKHLLVVPREKGCWVSVARGVPTPVLYNGAYLDSQEVQWGAELDVGTLTLRILESKEVVQAREQSSRSMLYIIGLLLLILGFFFVMKEEVVYAPSEPASAPALFDEGSVRCSAAGAEVLVRAEELRQAASAYWQRYPFDAQEGIRAAKFYGEAKACFKAGGDANSTRSMGAEEGTIIELVNKDFQTLRLQLARGLKNEEWKVSKVFVVKLANFVEHRPGDYLDWLARVNRYLRRKGA